MCMDNGPFLLIQGEEETSLEHVASILVREGGLRLIDLVGKTTDITGTIVEVDLMNGRIVLAG